MGVSIGAVWWLARNPKTHVRLDLARRHVQVVRIGLSGRHVRRLRSTIWRPPRLRREATATVA